MAGVVIHKEVEYFAPSRTWLLRMPLLATFAAQLAKLRSVALIMHNETHSYFFWLFVVLIAMQVR